MELLTQLPLSIKIGWVFLAAWSIAQAVWYTRVRIAPAPAPPHAPRAHSPAPRLWAEDSATATALPIGAPPEFLADLGLDDSTPAPTPAPAPALIPPPESAAHESFYRRRDSRSPLILR